MQGDAEKTKKKRRKKKSKFGYYLYAVVILVLTITNITIATLLITYVQQIHVTGNEISKESDIVAWIREDPLTANSLYTLWKFKSGSRKINMPVYLERVDVSLKTPWKVQVKVEEKQIIGCVVSEGAYVYFDIDGLVLKKTTEYTETIPLIEGIQVKDTQQFKTMQVDNEKVFSYIVSITEGIENKKNKLRPERIVWEEDSMNLYFGDICAKLGKSNFDEKLTELPALLEKAEGKQGTFHMEHYTKENKSVSFEKNT